MLALLRAHAAGAESPRLRIVARHALADGEEIVALAFAAGGRLVALDSSALSVYRVEAAGLRREARVALAPPLSAVRRSAGVLLGRADDTALWVLSNRTLGARLVEANAALLTRSSATAAPGALRFERGTSRLLGQDHRPLTAVSAGLEAVVGDDGELLVRGEPTGLHVGDAVAEFGANAFVVSAPVVNPADDALWLVERIAQRARVVQRLALRRRITALAARGEERVAVALQGEGAEIVLLDRVKP